MSADSSLRTDAFAIWQAGVDAVDSYRLVTQAVSGDVRRLDIAGHEISLTDEARILVVGAGKAGAGMAIGLEEALPPEWLARTDGWVNVPQKPGFSKKPGFSTSADDIATDDRTLTRILLHPARPVGVNEPTAEGVRGTQEILTRLRALSPDDVCIVLLSGGGSALLPAPVDGITLEDKQSVTRLLSQAGATIEELNIVRTALSEVKGGKLLQATEARTIITLIISDVIGDPLDVIASGPTVPSESTPADALAILERYAHSADAIPANVRKVLTDDLSFRTRTHQGVNTPCSPAQRVINLVIGNNATALDAAGQEAERRGYRVESLGSDNAGIASEAGVALAQRCVEVRNDGANDLPVCLLSGGEPVVPMEPAHEPRKGGRNQELVLAAVHELFDDGMDGIAVLSGGTDGEDGPTDAAGAVADAALLQRARDAGLDPQAYLDSHNSYRFFAATDGLLLTGPTDTNVMDVRVALVATNDSSFRKG